MIIKNIMKSIPCKIVGDENFNIDKITYDSRKADDASLFVCLVGARSDGHAYAESAYNKGCRAFVCQKKLSLPEDAAQIIVEDSRAALPTMGANFYNHPANSLKIIGITGTKGKTTTALLTMSVLNYAGKKCAYIGSNGVIIDGVQEETANTTPESLELQRYFRKMADAGMEYAAIEVSSQALGHHRVDGIEFHTVAYTNLSVDHIGEGEHPDFDDYKRCKRRLFTEHGAKYMVCNTDDEYADYMAEGFKGKFISYALNSPAELCAANIEKYRDAKSLGVRFDWTSGEGEKGQGGLMSPGYFSVYNALCAMGIAKTLRVDCKVSAEALKESTVQGRFEIVRGEHGITYVIDYSHNGFSLTSALKTLREYNPARLICLFGSVGGRTRGRREEMAKAADKYADYVIITSDNPDNEPPEDVIADIASHMSGSTPFECITDRKEAIEKAVEMAEDGDIILFAGKGHETYQTVNGIKEPFCEREIIKGAAKALAIK